MIGTQISHYKILEKIGQGGMGQVYLAEDSHLGRKAAIKFLTPEFSRNEDVKARFRREAKATAALNHQNIVTIYEFGDYEENPYIVMEYIDGESLRDLLRRKKLNLKEASSIILQVCEGLGKSHQVGIVHRDLKPENIFIDKDGRVKILDFGLAKFRSQENITDESTRLGTINYMSPEQLQGQEIDIRSDIFSLGVIFYELLTERTPFKGEYEASIIFSILNDDPPDIKDFNAAIPDVVQEIINRMLAKEKMYRYQTIQDFAGDLAGLSAGPGSESQADLASNVRSVEDLLEHRRKIDRLIESKYKRSILILFSDIVGSTQFFEQRGDIEGRAMVQRHQRLMFRIIKKHGGVVIKTMGDGIMISFDDVPAGCRCAIEMHQVLWQDNQSFTPEDRIRMRIAMHYGRAVIEKNDIYGDAVNVAARVEKYTDGDQIVLSKAVAEVLEGNLAFPITPIGSVSLKGKSEKMALYRLRWFDGENITPLPEYESEISEQVTDKHGTGKSGMVKIVEPFRLIIPDKVRTEALSNELKNPYMNRVMIQDVEEFFGRRNEVEKIYSRIGSSRPQSISLVGERRIGKSSLLNYINHPANRKKYLKNPDEFIFIFIDFQERRGLQIKEFFEIIFEALLEAFNQKLEITVEPDYEGFKKIVSTFDAQGLKLIMLFDEFELITKNKNFGSEFYSFCRSIANNYNVAYIVASGRNLQTLCHSKEISDSPFFNIFSNLTLGQFNHNEAVELVTRPTQGTGQTLTNHIDFIIDIAGYYPFFIQMACASLYEKEKEGHMNQRQLMEAVKEDFLDEAKVHFQQIWETSDSDQKEVILDLCENKKIPPSRNYIVKTLEKAGYVKAGKKKPELFSSLFGDYIINRFAASSGRKTQSLFWPFSGSRRRSG